MSNIQIMKDFDDKSCLYRINLPADFWREAFLAVHDSTASLSKFSSISIVSTPDEPYAEFMVDEKNKQAFEMALDGM